MLGIVLFVVTIVSLLKVGVMADDFVNSDDSN